ncbi:DUF4123 domain-containing protein [Aestuariibius sp. 2305UL40-4]|uniref:DUF4123 domain-containing protein n=1 Tax=Aestuariibius violaceus TaxID=3234132 RepID=UPI00345E4A03
MEPLDNQPGTPEPLTAPRTLRDTLFGQEGVIEGRPIRLLHTYAVLDVAKIPGLLELLEASDLDHACMFQGGAAEDLRDVAPWIARLEEGNTFTSGLFTQGDGPNQFLEREPGIYLRSSATFDELRKQLRKFTRLKDHTGRWSFFKFWEPRLFPPFADNAHLFPSYHQTFRGIMGDVADRMICPIVVRTIVLTASIPLPDPVPPPALPERMEIRRLILHRNMIDAANDLFEIGPDWTTEEYRTPRALSFLLREFIDFCLDVGIKDADIRSRMMELIFAYDRPRWPACLETKPFISMRREPGRSEDIALDWIYRMHWYLDNQKRRAN